MRKSVAFILLLCLLFSTGFAEDIYVNVNGTTLEFDVTPRIIEGRTMVPLRGVFAGLGADVDWNSDTQTVTSVKDGINVTAAVDSDIMYVNGKAVRLDVPPKIIDGRTLIPVRAVAEAFGCYVGWNGADKTVYIKDSSVMKVHFIDVGQGDSVFIQFPNNTAMLIDAGTNSSGKKVAEYIKAQNCSKIDFLVGTHPHEDHIGGLDDIINSFDIGSVYMPKVSAQTKTFEDVLTAVKNKGLTVSTAKAGVTIFDDSGVKAEIIAPVSDTYSNINDYSAVIKIINQFDTFLFMGDAEELSENQITADVKADVLKVGHHGSKTSSSMQFLNKVLPKYAVISVGKGNSYGHPAGEVMERLQLLGAVIYRTDESGDVIAVSDGHSITISGNVITDPPADNIVYITKTGKKYHREGCVANAVPVSLEQAKKDYQPCLKCNPPN